MDPCRLHAFGHWAPGNTERPNLKVRHEHPFAYGIPVLKLRGMFFHVAFRAVERTLSAKPLQVVITHLCTPIWHISNIQFTNQIGAEKHGLAAAKQARKRRRRPAPADHHSGRSPTPRPAPLADLDRGISPVKLSIAETARLAGLARQHRRADHPRPPGFRAPLFCPATAAPGHRPLASL
jgi:hypothetical protein